MLGQTDWDEGNELATDSVVLRCEFYLQRSQTGQHPPRPRWSLQDRRFRDVQGVHVAWKDDPDILRDTRLHCSRGKRIEDCVALCLVSRQSFARPICKLPLFYITHSKFTFMNVVVSTGQMNGWKNL